LRYKAKNTSIEPLITEDGNYKVYKWSVKNLAPVEYEEGAVAGRDRYPHVLIVTNKFSHYGFEGDLTSWKSFGAWIRDLYNGLDVLPADRQQFFLSLIKDLTDEKEKIRRIYNYMQLNFRYVSIQLGIGGLRPFSAEFTDKKKYGDCKALSNYMKAALKTVGIKSYVAIINAEYNEEPVDPDFPANEFNHVILCVPRQKDSVWLECTSSTAEFGVLGTFTENRNALLVTDDGGVLVQTPKSHAEENIISSITTVTISDDLSGIIETAFKTKGQYKEVINDILKENKDNQKQAIVYYFGFKQPDNFILTKDDQSDGNNAILKMAVMKVYEFNAGSKLFINPRMYKMWSRNLPKAENRRSDFYFRFPFQKNDTTIFKFPAGIKPDVLPKEIELTSDYAYYKTKYWYNEKENSIYSVTVFTLKQHKVPVASYASVKKFFDDIAQDDSQKIVVQKTATEKKAF
ncbi:MAG TPA: transglutaminase domain-containing protein, partial [Chitinophagaceae bacterium]|nr:transglutaminase domain-containing protein [Chitinophagaceae bacterium]